MTTFKSTLAICGLTQKQAAEYLGVSLQSVKHWGGNRTNPPAGVWAMLADLYDRIQDAADYASERIVLAGINPRAYGQIKADTKADQLPAGADSIAGAMALLAAISERG